MLCALLAGVPIAHAIAPHVAPGPVIVFPSPGSAYVNPATTITFRGVAPSSLGPIEVVGSVTGAHAGTWIADSDGLGASFVPTARFAPGERVTVHTQVVVHDASNGAFSFVVSRPSSVVRTPYDPGDEAEAPVNTSARALATPAWVGQHFRTRPDLVPPIMTPDIVNGATAPGYLAATPRGVGTQQPSAILFDNTGQLVWDQPAPAGLTVYDLKVARYHGQNVLMYWQGRDVVGHGYGEHILLDDTYHQVAVARMGNGYQDDLHDAVITPQNTALLMGYASVAADLSAYGGPKNGTVLELVLQEVDIATGAVLLEWHSLDHIPLSQSLTKPSADPALAWDYMHGNAVELDNDGNILLSARHTSSVYKLNRKTGAIMWTLGKGGDFTAQGFADGDWFSFQHDVRRRSDGTLSVFDNGVNARPYSRGLDLSVNEQTMTVSIVRILRGPGVVQALTQGNYRELAGGHDIIGWGSIGQITEYDAAGNVLFDMKYPPGLQSYRNERVEWDGRPTAAPNMVIDYPRAGTTRVAVSWNGATDVARWVMKAGADLADLTTVASSARTGFETTLTAATKQPAIQLVALDAQGRVLGSTATGPIATGYYLARANGNVRGFGTANALWNATIRQNDHVVGLATAPGGGYWIATARGEVIPVRAPSYGSLAGVALHRPIVGIAQTPGQRGYWLVSSDGGVFSFGDARFYGSAVRSWGSARHRTAMATGWPRRMAASSRSATPASTARPRGCHCARRSSGSPRCATATATGWSRATAASSPMAPRASTVR